MSLGKVYFDWNRLNSEQTSILRVLDLSAFECVASSECSEDLVTLLRSFNPDFVFTWCEGRGEMIGIVLDWLKVWPVTQSANIIVI
jgi:hypothetical protein